MAEQFRTPGLEDALYMADKQTEVNNAESVEAGRGIYGTKRISSALPMFKTLTTIPYKKWETDKVLDPSTKKTFYLFANNIVNPMLESLVPKFWDTTYKRDVIQDARTFDMKINYTQNMNFGVKVDMNDQKRMLDNIIRTGRYMEFDTEGLDTAITEFSIVGFSGADFKNGTHEGIKVHTNSASRAFIGLYGDDLQRAYSITRAAKDNSFGAKEGAAPKNLEYVLDALQKAGSDKTSFEIDKATGLYRLTSYAGDADVANRNWDDIDKGLEVMRKIGEYTHNLKQVDFTVNLPNAVGQMAAGPQTFHVRSDEAEIFRSFFHAQGYDIDLTRDSKGRITGYSLGNRSDDNTFTIAGRNTVGYDINRMQHKLATGTDGAQSLLRIMTQGSDDITRGLDFFDETIVMRGSHGDQLTKDQAYKIAARGTTGNKSEGIATRYSPVDIEEASAKAMGSAYIQHAAYSDTVGQGFSFFYHIQNAITPSKEEPNKSVNKIFDNIEAQRTANFGDVFYARTGMFSKTATSGFSGVIDGLTGEYRFVGGKAYEKLTDKYGKNRWNVTKSGVTVSADGTEKDVAPSIMNTFGLKKNTLNMYLGTQEFNLDNMDDAARKAFLSQLGEATNEKLSSMGTGNFYISFFTKYGTDNKNRDVQFFVGTLRETQEFFGKQVYAGSAITKKDIVQQEIDKAKELAWNDWQQQGKMPPLISQDVIESAIQKANTAPETVEGTISNKILEVWNYIRRHNPGMSDTIFKGTIFRKGIKIGKKMNRADMEDWQKTLFSFFTKEDPNEHLYIDQDKIKDAVFDFLDDFSNGDLSLMRLEGLPNINQATREELLKIKGIGPKTADKISQAIAAGEKIDAAKLRQIVGTDKRAKAIMSHFQTEDATSIGTRTEQILSAIDRYTERTDVEFSEAETVSLHNALSSIFAPNRKTFLEHFGFEDIKINPDGSIDESSISENAKKYIAQTDAIAKGQLYGKDLINEMASGKHDIKDVHYKMNSDGTVQRDKNGRPIIDKSKSVSTQSKKAMGAFENPRDFDTRKLITESIEHEEHSSLSDWIRGRNYNQTKRIMASMDVLDDITRNFFGIDNEYASNIRYASEHVLNALSPSVIAKLPNNQRANAKKTYGKLEHALGYTYNKKFHKPMSNTVVNTLRAIPYFEARKTIINAALAETEKNVEKNASSSYRDFYFQSVLHNMMAAVHNELDDPLDDNSPAKFSTRKIDKGILSFNIAPLSKNRVSTKRPETDNFAQILSIDLNEDSPHWVNQIKNKTGIKSDIEAVRAFASFLKAENPYNEQSKKYGRYRKTLNDIIEGPASPEFAMQQINNLLSEVIGDRFKKYLTKDEGEELGKKKEEWKKKKGAKARKQVIEEKKKFYENKPFLVQQRNFGIVPNDPTDQYIDPEYVPGALERFNQLDKEKQKEILTRGADLIGKYEMIGSKTTEETIEGIARDLNDISKKRIAFAVNKDDLERFGYNSKQAQRIMDDFNTRLTDTQAYIETLLKPILSDRRIGYSFDKEHGSLTLIDTTTGYQRDISNLLPRENYDPITGTFSTMFGGRKLATAKNFQEVTTYKDGTVTTYYDIVSNIKRLQLAIQPLMRGTNNSRRSLQDRIDYLSWAVRTGLNKIADKNINRFDVEDNRLSRSTSLLEFFQHLPYLYYSGAYDGQELNKKTRELLESDDIRNRYNKARETYEATHVNAKGKPTTEGFSFQINNLKTSEMATFLSDFNNLIAPMKEKDSRLSELLFQSKDDIRKRVYETLNEGTFKGGKHPEGAYESDTNFTKNIFGIFGPDNRHIESVANRSTYIQYDKYDDEFRKILGIDSVVSTKYRDNRMMERWYREKYAGDTKIDTLRVEKVTIDTNLAHRIAAARIKSGTPIMGNGYEIKNTSVLFAYLNESGSVADPRLLDGLSRNIVQKESTKDLMDLAEINRLLGRDTAARQEKIRNNTEQLIKFVTNQNGSLRYEYQEKENEKILLKRGDTIDYNLTYANTKQELTADRTGFLTRRYYDAQGRVVDQDDITRIINHDESLKEILLRENLKSSRANNTIEVSPSLKNAIDDVLESHGIRSRYAVEAIDTQTYKKMLDVSEKSVMQFPIAGLGEFDTRIRNLVNYARGTQPNSNEPYIAPNLSVDIIRDKEKLEAYLGSLSNDQTSPFLLDDALKKAGFKDIYDNNGKLVKTGFRDFVDVATKERGAYFEAYKGILEDYTGMDLSKTAVISATLAEWTKGSHQEVSRLQSGINDAIHFRAEQILKQKNNGMSFSDALLGASGEFSALLKKNNIFLDKNGNNIASSGAYSNGQTVIDQDALYTVNQKKLAQLITDFTGTPADRFFTLTKDAAKQLGMEGKELDNYADKVVISRGTAELSAVSDADEVGLNNGHNQKGFKITRRVMQNIEQDIVDTQSAQRLVASYQGLIDNGHDSANIAKIFNEKFADMGLSVTANSNKLELNPLKNTSPITNQGIISNLRQEVFRGGRGLIELESNNAIDDFIKNNQRDVAHLEAVGMSKDAIQSTLEGFKAAKVDAVSIDKMVSAYAYSTQNAAYHFNKAMSEAKTPEEQEKLLQDFFKDNKNFGASAHSIFDLHMDSKQFIDNDELNPMVRAGVIDLGPNVEKGKPRYIAYGFNNQPIMGNDDHNGVYTGDKVRDELYSLRSELDKNNEVEARLQRPVSDILSEHAENIIQAASDVRGAKNGTIDQMTSSYLVGSGMFKADIVRVRGASLENSILNEAKVDGLSLAEHAAAGHRINATFVSREAIENMMDAGGELDAALSAIGINKESFQKEKNIAISNLNASGGAAGIQGRHPSEYANSFSGSHIFLDDTLKGAEARVTDMSLAAENGDKDGDLVYAAMARADVEINGKKFRLNQLQIQTLQSAMQNNNLNFDVKYDEKQFNAFAASADYVGSASFSGVVDNALTSLNDEDIRQMTLRANTTTNVDVGGLLINTGGLTHEEQTEKINYAKQNIMTASNEDYVHAIEQYRGQKISNRADYSDEDWQKYSQDLVDSVTTEELGAGKVAIGKTSDIGSHESIANTYLTNKYGTNGKLDWDAMSDSQHQAAFIETEALAAHLNQEALNSEIIRTIMRKDAGLINMNTYRFRSVMQSLIDNGETNGLSSGDEHIIQQMIAHINEAGQAPKNATAISSGLENLDSALKDFFGVNRRSIRKKEAFYDILDQMIESNVKEYKNLPLYADIPEIMRNTKSSDEDILNAIKQRTHEAFDNLLADDRAINSRVYTNLRMGYAQSGIAETIMTQNKNDMLHAYDIINNHINKTTGWKEAMKDEGQPLTLAAGRSGQIKEMDGITDSADDFKEPTHFVDDKGEGMALADQIRGSIKSLKSMAHGHGAMAMLGFAGLTMMSGMIGGAPTAPQPSDQAQGISQENAMYEIPSTMTGQGTASGANQSYIININASTDQGRDFGENAISQAFANMPQTSNGGVNMTMNIKDSSSNIDFRDVANYISTNL